MVVFLLVLLTVVQAGLARFASPPAVVDSTYFEGRPGAESFYSAVAAPLSYHSDRFFPSGYPSHHHAFPRNFYEQQDRILPHERHDVSRLASERFGHPVRSEPVTVASKKECSTYKAYVRTSTTDDIRHRGTHISGLSTEQGYDVVMLEIVKATDNLYSCKVSSQHAAVSTYTFKMRLTAKENVAGRLRYKPTLTDIARPGVSGLELTGEEVIRTSKDIVADTIRNIMSADRLSFSEEGHIVIETEKETLVFVQGCSAVNGVRYGGLNRPIERGLYDKKRRLQDKIEEAVYTADVMSYKVFGLPSDFTEGYHEPIYMQCQDLRRDYLSCSVKVMNIINFSAEIRKDGSVRPGPITSTLMFPLGSAAGVEAKLKELLNGWTRIRFRKNGSLVFLSRTAELTWIRER